MGHATAFHDLCLHDQWNAHPILPYHANCKKIFGCLHSIFLMTMMLTVHRITKHFITHSVNCNGVGGARHIIIRYLITLYLITLYLNPCTSPCICQFMRMLKDMGAASRIYTNTIQNAMSSWHPPRIMITGRLIHPSDGRLAVCLSRSVTRRLAACPSNIIIARRLVHPNPSYHDQVHHPIHSSLLCWL